jgi:hypothetical protein
MAKRWVPSLETLPVLQGARSFIVQRTTLNSGRVDWKWVVSDPEVTFFADYRIRWPETAFEEVELSFSHFGEIWLRPYSFELLRESVGRIRR